MADPTSENQEDLQQAQTENELEAKTVEVNDEDQQEEVVKPEKETIPSGSLGEILDKPMSLKKRYREISEDDFVENPDGTHTIVSEELLNDLQEIFGDGTSGGDLKRFLHLSNSKPKKGDRISKIIGFNNRFQLSDLIIRYDEATKNGDADKIRQIESEFERNAPWLVDETTPPPFKIDIKKKKEVGVNTSEINQAVDKYCASQGLKRDDILSMPGLRVEFERFHGSVIGGKKLNADEALEYAMKFVPESKKFVSTGGVGKSSVDKPKDKKSELLGKIDEVQKERRSQGFPPLSQKFIDDVLAGKQTLE